MCGIFSVETDKEFEELIISLSNDEDWPNNERALRSKNSVEVFSAGEVEFLEHCFSPQNGFASPGVISGLGYDQTDVTMEEKIYIPFAIQHSPVESANSINSPIFHDPPFNIDVSECQHDHISADREAVLFSDFTLATEVLPKDLVAMFVSTSMFTTVSVLFRSEALIGSTLSQYPEFVGFDSNSRRAFELIQLSANLAKGNEDRFSKTVSKLQSALVSFVFPSITTRKLRQLIPQLAEVCALFHNVAAKDATLTVQLIVLSCLEGQGVFHERAGTHPTHGYKLNRFLVEMLRGTNLATVHEEWATTLMTAFPQWRSFRERVACLCG